MLSFNFWEVVFPIQAVVMILVGIARFHLDEKTGDPIQRYDERVVDILSVLMGLIFGILLTIESRRGIVQYFIDTLPPDSSLDWSPFLTAVAIIAISVIDWIIMNLVGWTASRVKEDKVRLKGRAIKKKIKEVQDDLFNRWVN